MIFAEVRSVFSSAMEHDEDFPFEFLQSAGGGTKSLIVPSRSSSFCWTAKQVVSSAGRGCIYILALEELCSVHKVQIEEVGKDSSSDDDVNLPEVEIRTTPRYKCGNKLFGGGGGMHNSGSIYINILFLFSVSVRVGVHLAAVNVLTLLIGIYRYLVQLYCTEYHCIF